MIRWHSLLQAHIAEYLVLHSFVSTHLSTDAQTLKKDLNTETFFNKFLKLFPMKDLRDLPTFSVYCDCRLTGSKNRCN
jgi:hypothetical protein